MKGGKGKSKGGGKGAGKGKGPQHQQQGKPVNNGAGVCFRARDNGTCDIDGCKEASSLCCKTLENKGFSRAVEVSRERTSDIDVIGASIEARALATSEAPPKPWLTS